MSSIKNKHSKVPAIIIYIGKTLQFFSVKWTTLYLSRLFTTPIKHKIPRRELQMDRNSIQTKIIVPVINKEIFVYQLGTGEKKLLLVHGWSGRGTQLVKFADAFAAKGYSTVSFDAPAHGKSPGNTTIMTDFITSITEVDNSGRVEIFAEKLEDLKAAVARIKSIVAIPEVGEVYEAKVKSIMPYGAFVEFMPGKEGLLHISEYDWKRIDSLEGLVKEGDMVSVKYIGTDPKNGKAKLSRKALLPKPETAA